MENKGIKMSNAIKNWSITVLCLSVTVMIWMASSPNRLGYWEAQRDIAYDSVWSEYVSDCDCGQPVE